MQVEVKVFDGRIICIDVEPFNTVYELKEKINDHGIPQKVYMRVKKNQTPKDILENPTTKYFSLRPEEQRLIWGGKQLEDNRTLKDYNMKHSTLIHLCARLRGGNIPINFVNVEKGLTENLSFSDSAPKWRGVEEGLNIFGICKYSNCKAFNKEVIYKVGINCKFNLQENITKIKCPMCNKIIMPKTCGFWKCEYQFEGDKIEDGEEKHINTKSKETQGDNFEYFNAFDNGSVIWTNLNIYAVEKQGMKYN